MKWYSKPKEYLQNTFTRSGRGVLMMGKTASNTIAVMGIPTSSGYGSGQTSATGANWVALTSQVAGTVIILNATGTNIDVSKDGGTTKIVIPTGVAHCVQFITNADQVSIRRTDQSGTQVTLYYEWKN